MNQMTICLVIFILTLLAYAFLSSRVSMAVISLISVAALMLTGCMDPNDALGCFANSSAILMASMFIVSAGLNRTQMVKKISAFICRISKGSFTKVLTGYVILTCILAQFIPVREFIGYATFVCVLLGLLFSGKIGLPTWEIAFIGALVIAASGILNKKELIESMNLSMVLLFVGALAIGTALSGTGVADMIGNHLSSIILGVHNNYIAGLIFFLAPFVLTQFMLNLGIYSIFVPLYIMICKSMGANPIGPIMLCMIASMTAFFTPLATPAVPLMMGAGNYSVKQLVKMGWIPFLAITVVSVFWIMTIYPIF